MTYSIGNVLDVLPTLAAGRFRTCVTSPPYWGLRSYETRPTEAPAAPEGRK